MDDWDELLRHEGPAVWRIAYRLVRNTADADECFQETFLAAVRVHSRQRVRNWPALLHRLATSRAIDCIRKQLKRRRLEDPADVALAPDTDADPARDAEATELANSLRHAIGELPQRQAEVFCLNEFAGWNHQRIGEQLGMTANAVGVILHRARQRLQQLLKMYDRAIADGKHSQPDKD